MNTEKAGPFVLYNGLPGNQAYSPKVAMTHSSNPHTNKLKVSKSKKRDDDTNVSGEAINPSIVSPPLFELPPNSQEEITKMKNFLEFTLEEEDKNLEEVHKQSEFSDDEGRMAAEDENVSVFTEPPQANLMCPIHRGLFVFPVIAKCGHTFCKTCFIRWVENGAQQMNECPLDKTVFKQEDLQNLINNLVVADSITNLKIYCKYGCKKEKGRWIKDEAGCQQIMPVSKRKEHEDICPFATIRCPYSDNCPPIRRMYLDEHLKICTRISCPHKNYGCSFRGTKTKVEGHITSCPYEQIKGYIQVNEQRLDKLKLVSKSKEDENKMLQTSIAQLTQRIDFLSDSYANKISRLESVVRQLTTSLEGTQNQLAEAEKEIEALRRKKKNNPDEVEPQFDHFEMLNCKGTFTGHTGPVWGLAVTSDGFIVSASSDMTIKIWDVANFKCKQTLSGHEGIVHAVVVHGNKLCSGSSDKTIRIWDLSTMQCVKVIRMHDNTICSLAVSPDGRLFSGSFSEIKIWDTKTYTCVRTITGNYGSIYSLAISKEHKRLLSGTYENKINIYDLDTYQCKESLSGHIGAVYTLAVTGNKLFSGSYDSTIKIWNMETLKCLQTMVRHSSSVDALVTGGGFLFSASADHSVKVWK